MPAVVALEPGFAVIDLETTGISPDDERIVEVAVIVLDAAGHEVEHFATLIDPGRDPGPTHVHGITADMLVGAPTFADVHPYVASLLSGRVVVGHNVDEFDLAFLRVECRRLGEDRMPAHVVTLDTLSVAQTHLDLSGQARLIDCCDRYRLTWKDHHNALGDARVTAELLGAMRVELGDDLLSVDRLLTDSRSWAWPGATAARPVGRDRPGSRRTPVDDPRATVADSPVSRPRRRRWAPWRLGRS